jgi:hypothetical protein
MKRLRKTVIPVTESPVSENTNQLMDLPTALRIALLGKKITKKSWGDEGYYVFFKGLLLTLRKPDESEHNLILTTDDFALSDWYAL